MREIDIQDFTIAFVLMVIFIGALSVILHLHLDAIDKRLESIEAAIELEGTR